MMRDAVSYHRKLIIDSTVRISNDDDDDDDDDDDSDLHVFIRTK